MSHASTIAASGGRLVAAWFGGSLESRPDVGILVSLNDGSGWSTPVEVDNGVQQDGTRYAVTVHSRTQLPLSRLPRFF